MQQAVGNLHRPTALLLFATLVVRGGLFFLMAGNLDADPDRYRRLAENLVVRHTLGDESPILVAQSDGSARVRRAFAPTAYRPPLYPLLLTSAVAVPGGFVPVVASLHVVFGLLTVWLTVRVGLRLNLGKAALLAGALVALDPILLFQSSLVMTESLATLLAVAAIGAFIRCTDGDCASNELGGWRRCALAGGTLALAVLCRPTFLLMLPLAGILLWWNHPRNGQRGRSCTAYLLAAVLVLLPWLVRNTFVFGRPIVATTHGGYTFHLANNPGFYQFLRDGAWGEVWTSENTFRLHAESDLLLSMTHYPEQRMPEAWKFAKERGTPLPHDVQQYELWLNELHYADAWSAITDEPLMFAWSVVVRWGRMWQPLPHVAVTSASQYPSKSGGETTKTESTFAWVARHLVAAWYLGIYLLALGGLASLGRKLFCSPWCWPTLLVASFMVVHAFYWTDMRMRAPLVPVVCWWACAGWNCYQPWRRMRKV